MPISRVHRRWIAYILGIILSPIIFMTAFNYTFQANIPWTLDSWVWISVVHAIMLVVFLGLLVLFVMGAIQARSISILLVGLIAFIIFMPVLEIFLVNIILGSAIPINIWSYLLIWATGIGLFFILKILGRLGLA